MKTLHHASWRKSRTSVAQAVRPTRCTPRGRVVEHHVPRVRDALRVALAVGRAGRSGPARRRPRASARRCGAAAARAAGWRTAGSRPAAPNVPASRYMARMKSRSGSAGNIEAAVAGSKNTASTVCAGFMPNRSTYGCSRSSRPTGADQHEAVDPLAVVHRELRGQPAAERGADDGDVAQVVLVEEVEVEVDEVVHVVDPVQVGRLPVARVRRGDDLVRRPTSRSWNGSHRPPPPVPCRNSSGGPSPPRSTCSLLVANVDELAAGCGRLGHGAAFVRRRVPAPAGRRARAGAPSSPRSRPR